MSKVATWIKEPTNFEKLTTEYKNLKAHSNFNEMEEISSLIQAEINAIFEKFQKSKAD